MNPESAARLTWNLITSLLAAGSMVLGSLMLWIMARGPRNYFADAPVSTSLLAFCCFSAVACGLLVAVRTAAHAAEAEPPGDQ